MNKWEHPAENTWTLKVDDCVAVVWMTSSEKEISFFWDIFKGNTHPAFGNGQDLGSAQYLAERELRNVLAK